MIGIYKITNLINDKIYIGQSNHIENRWGKHIRNSFKENRKQILYQAMRKYGIENFKFEILKECERKDLNCLEQFYIRVFCSWKKEFGYNMTLGGDSNSWLWLTNEEHQKRVERFRKTLKERNCKHGWEKGHKPWNTGLHHSEETKKKISEKGKLYKPTEETKNKISSTMSYKRTRPLYCVETNEHFISARKAAETYNLPSGSMIHQACKKGTIYHNYHWRYEDENVAY